MASAESCYAGWIEILDRLERELAVAVSGGGPTGWAPPEPSGPVPAELRERAERLLDAQRESLDMVLAARLDAARHLNALRAVPDVGLSGRPHYLDVTG